MANALHDQNHVPTLTTALNTDGATIVQLIANPSTHVLSTADDITGSDFGPANALHDGNRVTTMMAVSSADGVTPVALYADSSGNLLINSN